MHAFPADPIEPNTTTTMNRRSFLTLAGSAFGSFLIPSAVARRIQDVCLGNSQPLILAPANHSFDLYAEDYYGDFMLHLGNPTVMPEAPTLREYMESHGYDVANHEDLEKYLVECREFEESNYLPLVDAISLLQNELDDPIDGYEFDTWVEWDLSRRDGTMPMAYDYLENLSLDDGRPFSGLELGSLSFIDGDGPGSNVKYVTASGLSAIASLQHRLNQLHTGARIVMV